MNDEVLPSSHLFTIRIWSEMDDNGELRWRGKLRHVPSEEVRYFRGWAALIPLMMDMLRRYHDQAHTGT